MMNGMKSLIFGLCLVLSVSAEPFKIGLTRIQNEPTMKPNASRFGQIGRLYDIYQQSIVNTQNIWYKGVITVGTPPQSFELMFDTGSDLLWIPGVGCRSSGAAVSNCATQQSVYRPTSSRTSRNLGSTFSISYGTGSASGTYYSDVFAFGSPSGPQLKYPSPVVFGVAQQATFMDMGVFGLSFPSSNRATPVFMAGIQQRVFDQNIFTAYFANCALAGKCQNGGQITFGGLDTEHCSRQIDWIPINSNVAYWQFTFQGIQAGSYSFSQTAQAITDTGTSYIIGPQAQVQQIATAVGATFSNGAYYVNCNAQFTVTPTINGKRYPIQARNMMINLGGGYCQLTLTSGNFGFWIFGDAFIRQYCQIYDVQNRRVGFAAVTASG